MPQHDIGDLIYLKNWHTMGRVTRISFFPESVGWSYWTIKYPRFGSTRSSQQGGHERSVRRPTWYERLWFWCWYRSTERQPKA